LAPGTEGCFTTHVPSGEQMSIYEAAMHYAREGVPLLVIAGKEYGTGSSRDWAAKGVLLLGVRAVIAESFERIHRSNLVGMGVLPLQFPPGTNRNTLQLDGSETFALPGQDGPLVPGQGLILSICRADGRVDSVPVTCRLNTADEVAYYNAGGILHHVLRKLIE